MITQRLLWGGGVIVSGISTYLAYAQVDDQLAKWSACIIFVLLFIASMVMFPWGQNEDGSARRLINVGSRGHRHATLVAGGDSPATGNIQNTGDGDVTVTTGLSVAQVSELKKHLDDQVTDQVELYVERRMAAFTQDVAKYTGEAQAQAIAMGRHLITEFIEQLAGRAPQNIAALGSADMQHAILNAQTSAAVANSEELADTLVDILVDKSGSEPRSFKGVVLTEALQVAGKLTADQINLLTALVILTRTVSLNLDTDELILNQLDAECRPLYDNIPSNKSALQYMSYTGVGYIEQATGLFTGNVSILNNIIRTYNGVFTPGFPMDDIPEELRQYSDFVVPLDERYAKGDRYRFKLASSQTLDKLIKEGAATELLLTHKDRMQQLMTKGQLPTSQLMAIIATDKPALAEFLQQLDNLSTGSFHLSTVGIALGQANWRRLQPEVAPAFDIYLT